VLTGTFRCYLKVSARAILRQGELAEARAGRLTVMSEEETTMGENNSTHVPVTYERCEHIDGPCYHGTKSAFKAGDELVPGHGSNFHEGRVSNHIYFTTLADTAAWGAELATALAGSAERGHIYVVEPLGRSKTTRT